MKIVVSAAARRALFRDLDEAARPAHDVLWSSATAPTTRSAGASCSPTRRSENLKANDPDSAAAIRGQLRPLGRHRRPHPGATHPLRRPRLQRHRAQAAAPHPAGARAGARRRAAVRARGRGPRRPRRRPIWSSPPTASTAASASQLRRRLRADIELRRNKFIWLGTDKAFDAFTFIFEETEHGWIWAHAYRFDDDTSTFIVEMRRGDLARARLRPDEPGGRRSPPARSCSRSYLDGQRLMSNAQRTCAARLAQLPARRLRALAPRQHRAARRRRAHRAFLDRLRHQAGARGRDRARRGAARRGATSRARSPPIRTSAGRGAEAAERGAQLDRVVRERRRATSRLEPQQFAYSCSPAASASATRTCACATGPGSRASSAGSPSARAGARCSCPCRRCSRRSGCASSSSRTASWSRRWPCTRPRTARRATSISCIRRARAGRRRPRLHRDDLRLARGADHAGLRRACTRPSTSPPGGASSTSCTGTPGQDLPAARPRRAQGLDQARLGRHGRAAREGNWPSSAPSAVPWSPRQPGAAPDDPRRHGPRARRVRARDRDGRGAASTWSSCTAPTAICSRLPHAAHQPAHRRVRRQPREPAALPARGVPAMRAAWPQEKPMSVRISATDWVEDGITGEDAVEIAPRVREPRAPTSSTSPPARPARDGEAGLRPHVPDAVHRPHPQRGRRSRPWRSATSSSRTTSTASSPPAAPTCAAWRGRTWPIRTGRCTPPRSSAIDQHRLAAAVSLRPRSAARAT